MDLCFMIIDDSELDCFIAKKIIQDRDDRIKVIAYTDASNALSAIKEHHGYELLTVILLDLRLPMMNGFEFIEAFELLPQVLRSKYLVYVLSSTMNVSDFNRVGINKNFVRMLSKPLSKASLEVILTDVSGYGNSNFRS